MRAPRVTAALAAIPLMLAGMVGVAHADIVDNDVSSVGDTNITAGGSTTIGYQIRVQGAGLDGEGGCNATASPVIITLGIPAGVTASAGSLTFSACNTLQEIGFGSSVPGDYPVTVTSIVGSGPGVDPNVADWTLHVSAPVIANTPPNVSVGGVQDGAPYSTGSVPLATCVVTDADDGAQNVAAQLSAATGDYAVDGIGSQRATCSYTDHGGLTRSASATYTSWTPARRPSATR